MRKEEGYHVPIMPNEVLSLLPFSHAGIYVDGTLGGGGHSHLIFDAMQNGSALYGIDRDEEAIAEATQKIQSTDKKTFSALHGNFFDMKNLITEKGMTGVDGILLDLGLSSHQLDEAERGFSYMQDAKLDMRMDKRSPLSAYDVVNGYSDERLARIIREYGEERFAGRIARSIVNRRTKKPIETTLELVDCIKAAMPKAALAEKQHPAKRTFQAIRIEVNGELDGLENAIENATTLLNPGGVIAIITFHSLEDRIVKQTFLRLAKPCTCDPKAPICTCNKVATVEIVTRKPIIAQEEELEQNPRSRSAKLRAAKKI